MPRQDAGAAMSDQLCVKLSGDCSVRAIRALQAEIAAALAATADLSLDCAEVERADIAFVQLVVSAAGTAERQAKRLTLAAPSEVVRGAFARAGLSAQTPFAAAA